MDIKMTGKPGASIIIIKVFSLWGKNWEYYPVSIIEIRSGLQKLSWPDWPVTNLGSNLFCSSVELRSAA